MTGCIASESMLRGPDTTDQRNISEGVEIKAPEGFCERDWFLLELTASSKKQKLMLPP